MSEVKQIHIDAKALGLRSDVTEAQIAQALIKRFSGNGSEPELPIIIAQGGDSHLRDTTGEATEALITGNCPPSLFVRGGALSRILKNERGEPVIDELNEHALRGRMERTANYIRVNFTDGKEHPVSPPMEVVRDILSLGEWDLPCLQGIVETPFIRPDGTVITKAGYDEETRLYYTPSRDLLNISPVSDNPTDKDVADAKSIIEDDIIRDFPFVDLSSKANAVAALMTIPLRTLNPRSLTPLAMVDKPAPGTGASLFTDITACIATGRPGANMTACKDEDEWAKTITSLLREGRTVIVLDNVEGKLFSSSLSSALTSYTISRRGLGGNKVFNLENNACWFCTGNNVKLGGDLPRRTYWIRLDSRLSQPWLRKYDNFKHPQLIDWVLKNRTPILHAFLTIARAWIRKGKPKAEHSPTWGGYQIWADTMAGILDFMGIEGFLSNMSAMYEVSDQDTSEWERFMLTWYDIFGDTPTSTQKVKESLASHPELIEVLPGYLGDFASSDGFSRRLGKYLSKHDGRHFTNGLALKKSGEFRKAISWRVYYPTEGDFREFGEFGELNTPPPREILKTYKSSKENNTQNTQNSHFQSSDRPEKDDNKPPTLEYPPEPCPNCSSSDYWPTPDGRWLCKRCHPE
ncbi:hypothetical protein ACFLWX_02695 [Chloroflexota bacterium]